MDSIHIIKMFMNEAELYNENNQLQKRDAKQVLEDHGKKIKWKGNDKILDIGCGDGSVTMTILEKCIPVDYDQINGCDISDAMINFAKKTHWSEKTNFFILDIEGTLPKLLHKSYDRIFSFFALNWVRNQRRGFTNIYDVMKDEADCLITFTGRNPVFDVFRVLACNERWSKLLNNVESAISPYHDCKEPEKDIKLMMKDIGYKNVDVIRQEAVFTFPSEEDFKCFIEAVNIFPIPKEKFGEYLEDFMNEVRESRVKNLVFHDIKKSSAITVNYDLLIAYGSK